MGADFDSSAATYDEDFERLPAIRRIRNFTTHIACNFFPKKAHILELNCGTGTDAIALASEGFRVYATDASASMVTMARRKLENVTAEHRPEFHVLPFEKVGDLKGRIFDGVFSNMGGLNCLRDLSALARSLSSLTRPGSHVVATFLSDFCLWEKIAFLIRLSAKGMTRRRSGGKVIVAGTEVTVYYHSPAAVRAAFDPFFEFSALFGLNVFTPPPASTRAYRQLRTVIPILNWVDDRIASLAPFNRIGDHFVIVLHRKITI